MWQQADGSVVRADVVSDSSHSFTVLDGGRGEVSDENYVLSVCSDMKSDFYIRTHFRFVFPSKNQIEI